MKRGLLSEWSPAAWSVLLCSLFYWVLPEWKSACCSVWAPPVARKMYRNPLQSVEVRVCATRMCVSVNTYRVDDLCPPPQSVVGGETGAGGDEGRRLYAHRTRAATVIGVQVHLRCGRRQFTLNMEKRGEANRGGSVACCDSTCCSKH